jgi:hypothetical protein
MQWCQSNFSSIEDIKTRRNRGDFRQNIGSIRGDAMFPSTLEKGIFGLIPEGQIIVPKRKIKKEKTFCIFFLANFGVLKQIFS